MRFSKKALDLILGFEKLESGDWPGGASGVTIGHGYDLGYHTKEQFLEDWSRYLSPRDLKLLQGCCGLKGQDAKQLALRLSKNGGVVIPKEAATQVFFEKELPRYIEQAQKAFPGLELLPADAHGAVVSLVFNRGASMGVEGKPSWDLRREMRQIRQAVKDQDLFEIARQLRLMKRLWEGKNMGGLLRRRDDEAALVEEAGMDTKWQIPEKANGELSE